MGYMLQHHYKYNEKNSLGSEAYRERKHERFFSLLCNTFIEELFVDAPNCEGISEHIEYFNNLKN